MSDFKENIQIDKYSLDLEFEKHPMLYHEFAMDLILAEEERDTAKDKLELIRSQLDLAIRSDPKLFLIDKLTEGAINSTINQNKKFQESQATYNKAVNSVRVLKVAVESLNQKKAALENLVRLYLGEYYSKEAPREIKENAAERVADFIHDDLNRRSKLRNNDA
jgi:hypothetical protein